MIARFSLSLAAAALAAWTAPARAAGLQITTSVFTLTFPEGWIKDTTGLSEFPVVVLDTALDVSCLMTTANLGKPTATKDIRIPNSTFSRGDSVFKADEGTLSIGGREFLWAQYRGRDTAGADTNMVRAYYHQYDTSHIFCGFVDYLAPGGNPAVTQFETALATLDYPGPVGLVPGPVRSRANGSLRPRDAMGRTRAPAERGPRFRPSPR